MSTAKAVEAAVIPVDVTPLENKRVIIIHCYGMSIPRKTYSKKTAVSIAAQNGLQNEKTDKTYFHFFNEKFKFDKARVYAYSDTDGIIYAFTYN